MHATAEHALDALYLYIDEAGNFDFGHTGTRHFVLTGVLMRRPFTHLAGLLDVKYDVLEEGLDLEYFHASEDRQAVRDRVFRCLAAHGSGVRMLCVVACKAELDPELRTPERLYATAFDQLVREALNALAPMAGGADHRRHRLSACAQRWSCGAQGGEGDPEGAHADERVVSHPASCIARRREPAGC